VLLVLVAVVLVELELTLVAGAEASAVAPAEGAGVTPGALELPHPAAASARRAIEQMRVIGLRMEVVEGSERLEDVSKKR
jgi:hypothetical protein